MYIWMILATFIVMLATYNLSPRTDIAHVQIAPQAEATIAKFLYQHKAAEKYTKNLIENNETIPAGEKLRVCNEDREGDLCDYLPLGFKYDEDSYFSYIYCMIPAKKTTAGWENNASAGQYENCAIGNVSKNRYVVTYGKVPIKWKNVATGKVRGDFYKAMRSRIPVSMACGLITRSVSTQTNNPLHSAYVVEGISKELNASIPNSATTTEDFKKDCMSEDELLPCLVCVSNNM